MPFCPRSERQPAQPLPPPPPMDLVMPPAPPPESPPPMPLAEFTAGATSRKRSVRRCRWRTVTVGKAGPPRGRRSCRHRSVSAASSSDPPTSVGLARRPVGAWRRRLMKQTPGYTFAPTEFGARGVASLRRKAQSRRVALGLPAEYRSAMRRGKIGIRRGIGGVSTGGGLGVARAVGINRSPPPRNAPLEVSWRSARSSGYWNTPS